MTVTSSLFAIVVRIRPLLYCLPALNVGAVTAQAQSVIRRGDARPEAPTMDTSRADMAALPMLHFEQHGTQLLVEIPRRALDTDLFVLCETVSRGPARTTTGGEVGWCPGTLIDGPDTTTPPTFLWRLSQDGDSLLIQGGAQLRVPILRYGRDRAPVIDAGTLFRTGTGPAPTVRHVVRYPTHIDVEIAQGGGSGGASTLQRWRVGLMPYRPVRTGHDNPYIPRLCGIRQLLLRNPWAARSEVVNPIVYYISAEVPPQWLPYVKRGVEAWNAVFDAIGLQHAIYAVSEDESVPAALARVHQPGDVLNWSPPSPPGEPVLPPPDWIVAGVTVQDTALPRLRTTASTGNQTDQQCPGMDGVLREAPITIGGDAIPWLQEYLLFAGGGGSNAVLHAVRPGRPVRCPPPEDSSADARAESYCPVPDSLVGRGVALVVAHEMGHALGLGHNFAGRWTYPVDSLRSRAFLARMQLTPTVMDYSLFNYVTQVSDRLPDSLVVKSLGPYDRWAITWLYRPIPEALTPEAEAPTLARWQAAADTAVYLHGGGVDEADSRWSYLLGADALRAVEYDLQNLGRLAATFDLHEEDMLWEWVRVLHQAVGPEGPVPLQVATVHFLLEHVVLGRDPLLQAAHITWDSVPAGWDLARWRRRQTTLLSSIQQMLQGLLAAPSAPGPTDSAATGSGMRARGGLGADERLAVCREVQHTATMLGTMAQHMNTPTARAHADTVRSRLTGIAQAAACPP